MMKKIFKLSALFAMFSLIGLTGCTEELSTDQFDDDAVVLSAFAPNPVVRGAELRMMGSNLDKIVEVQIPGSEPITEIQVVATGRLSEIRIVIPKDGAEDASVTGPVVLVDNSGSTYTSKTDLSFTEGIVFDSFAPASAMPGDEITVKGDYLYNVQQIVLNNGVYVTGDQITAKSRRELKFIVPSAAVTGPVTIGDVDENNNPDGLIPNNIPSEEVLTIGSPTVKSAARGMLKAGAEIKIEGSYLDMIQKAAFRVGEADTQVDFALAEDHKSVKVVLPATVADGEVVLTSYAGEEFKAGAYTTVVPTEVAIKAESRYKAGLNAVVTGKDLDLVTGATLGGRAAEFEYADGAITVKTELTSVSGKVAFTLGNGVTVESADEVTVKYHSKVIVTEMPAMQHIGQEVVLKGSNFSLVENIFIGDVKVTQYSIRTDEEVRFLMPWNKAGMYSLSFHLFDGDVETVATQIEVGLELDIKTIWEGSMYISWSGMSDLSWGGYDWSTVKPGTVLTAYFDLDPGFDWWQVRFGNGSWSSIPSGMAAGDNIPMVAGATYYSLTLTADDINALVNEGGLVMTGTNYTLTKLTLTSEISQEVTLWEGELIADDWANQPYALSDAGLELQQAGAQAGQVINFYLEPIEPAWKLEIVEGHWGPTYCSYCSVGNDTEGGKFTEYDLAANGGKLKVTLTQAMLDAAFVQQWWGGTFVLNGDNVKVTKITLL